MANENGWGDGVLNNTIGWGQGSDNEIGWGSIYGTSDAGLTALEDSASLLLDLYPNAAAAYSVRKLRSGYSGSALRVRRSSDNAELDIGFVGNDLDTASLLTFVGASNGFVPTWYDQSNNLSNLTQSSASIQPKIINAGSIITSGGIPAVKFNGIDQYLSNTVNLFGEVRLDQFFLIDTDGDTKYIYPNNINTGSVRYGMFALSGNASDITSSNYGSPAYYSNSVAVDTTSRHTVYRDTNGRNVISHINANTSVWAEYRFGFWSAGDLNFAGSTSAIIAYASDQSSNRIGIETILDSIYNP